MRFCDFKFFRLSKAYNNVQHNKFDWFFDDSIVGCENADACNYNSNVINNDLFCIFPGEPCESASTIGIYDENCECLPTNTIINEESFKKKLLYTFDFQGKQSIQPKFKIEIYNNLENGVA